jgi:hypothetical protein
MSPARAGRQIFKNGGNRFPMRGAGIGGGIPLPDKPSGSGRSPKSAGVDVNSKTLKPVFWIFYTISLQKNLVSTGGRRLLHPS